MKIEIETTVASIEEVKVAIAILGSLLRTMRDEAAEKHAKVAPGPPGTLESYEVTWTGCLVDGLVWATSDRAAAMKYAIHYKLGECAEPPPRVYVRPWCGGSRGNSYSLAELLQGAEDAEVQP